MHACNAICTSQHFCHNVKGDAPLCSDRMTVEDTVPISGRWESLEFGRSREEQQKQRWDMVKLARPPPRSHWLVQGMQRPAVVGRRRLRWRRLEGRA